MNNELTMLLCGVVLGMFGVLILVGSFMNHNEINRALSCMAAGNTIAQCQDILGVTPH